MNLRNVIRLFGLVVLLSGLISCGRDPFSTQGSDGKAQSAIPFNAEKWRIRQGDTYPFRAAMLQEMLYTDTVRGLRRAQILELLGQPDRQAENHLYYMVEGTRLGFVLLHSRFLVIKLKEEEDAVEWIKIHE